MYHNLSIRQLMRRSQTSGHPDFHIENIHIEIICNRGTPRISFVRPSIYITNNLSTTCKTTQLRPASCVDMAKTHDTAIASSEHVYSIRMTYGSYRGAEDSRAYCQVRFRPSRLSRQAGNARARGDPLFWRCDGTREQPHEFYII